MRVALQLHSYVEDFLAGLDRDTATAAVQRLYELAYKEGYKDAQEDCAENEDDD